MRYQACVWAVLCLAGCSRAGVGGLYPRQTASRDLLSLDGLWNFRLTPTSDSQQGYKQQWYKQQLKKTGRVEPMYVPSSYNDMQTDEATRDFVGVAWYDKLFYVPTDWKDQRVWLRFGGVDYKADVWLNGNLVAQHEFGQLPFYAEITSRVQFGKKNLVTVAVNNTLSKHSIPQGAVSTISTEKGKVKFPSYQFDFFHYSGIDQSVQLYTTPRIFIDDITVKTGINLTTGMVQYTVTVSNSSGSLDSTVVTVNVVLVDREDQKVATASGASGMLEVPEATLWWPRYMSADPGYLYHLHATVTVNSTLADTYVLPVGIRVIEWSDKKLLINKKELYLRGFNRHQDSDFRGRGLDYSVVTRDHLLLGWSGSNSYRTTHYPHSEEIMDICDKMGFLVIDEVPFTNIDGWDSEFLVKHKQILSEMIARDKNRPSVVMWSIGNDLDTSTNGTTGYVRSIVQHVKSLDTSRPVTLAINQPVREDQSASQLDVISLNAYFGWDSTYGRLDGITRNLENLVHDFHTKHNKPVLVTEYGADAYQGLHNLPEAMWSEDYQTALLSRHFQALDALRRGGGLVGELAMFSDYKTRQERTRVDGNRMGVFTRQRQPKQSAHMLRQRYCALAEILDNATLPSDVNPYISESASLLSLVKTEL
ncbi:beta-glucuronidase-like [Bacillus rossius redtenbacheri]|uniref:beta-glucuronidase-like n=1 Tax=Bacillus rossius redtenbacheri TaxID=93214 RepID=UPI002FDD8F77